MFEVKIYAEDNGGCPFEEWRRGLGAAERARATKAVESLALGHTGNCRRLVAADGVCELRLDFGPGYRIYYGQDGRTLVLLLCGGDKSTQRRDIVKAMRLWSKYREGKTK